MKKLFTILILGLLTVACNQEDSNLDQKKKQLQDYQSQVDELKEKIAELQDDIELMDSASTKNLKKVTVIGLSSDTFTHYIELRGVVESKSMAMVSPEMNGAIQSIKVSAGDKVSKGDIIAVLDADVMSKQVQELKTSLQLAKTVYEKQKSLWDQNIGSEMQYLQAKNNYESLQNRMESTQTQLGKAYIRSPITGVVDEVFSNQGENAFAGNPIARIVNLSDVEVNVDVPERYLSSINKGGKVKVNFPTLDMETEATITSVGQYINPNNRTFKVGIHLDNKEAMLKPNLLASVYIKDYEAVNAITIPTKYILQSPKGDYVYIAEQKGETAVIKTKPIETGDSYKGMTEVKSGLSPGHKLVTAGFNIVVDGQQVMIAEE